MQNTTTAQNENLIDSGSVEGTRVFDMSGKEIGSIKRLMIEKTSGRVVYTVAKFGGLLGVGGNEVTIPWTTLRYDTNLGGYRTNISAEQVKGAPAFGAASNDGYADRARERDLHDHYQSPYYWSE